MDKLAALNAFCTVAECESFSQAARRLALSVARISKQVAQLEERLGIRLLERTTRKVRLTESGQLYYQRCRPLLDELDDAEASVLNLSGEVGGRLKVSVPEDFGLHHVAPHLHLLLERYPKLNIEVHYANRQVDLHSEGFDLAIRIGQLQDSSLVARPLAPVRIITCASPAYLQQHGHPRSPEDLQHHNCLIYTHSPQPDVWGYRVDNQWREYKVSGNLRSNSGLAMVESACSGLGIVNKPMFMLAEHLKSGALVELLPDHPGREITMSAVYLHRRSLSPKVRLVIDFLQQQIGSPPYWELT